MPQLCFGGTDAAAFFCPITSEVPESYFQKRAFLGESKCHKPVVLPLSASSITSKGSLVTGIIIEASVLCPALRAAGCSQQSRLPSLFQLFACVTMSRLSHPSASVSPCGVGTLTLVPLQWEDEKCSWSIDSNISSGISPLVDLVLAGYSEGFWVPWNCPRSL